MQSFPEKQYSCNQHLFIITIWSQ